MPETVTCWDYLRPEVRAFAIAMENQLRANDHKGGWQGMGTAECIERLQEEMEELEIECDPTPPRKPNPEQILKEAADVANFAMFAADVAGGLPLLEEAPCPLE